MKKTISLLLVVLLIFWLPAPVVYASGAEEYLNRENLTNLAKGIAALYVINRASSYLSNRDENSERDEGSEGERFDEQPEIEPSQVVDDLVIVLDPGHGGFDPGAIGPGGLKEKDVVLDITRKLADILQNSTEARVYLTRNDDTFISLPDRVRRANNWNPDIFISIHSNGSERGTGRGIETFADYGSSSEAWALAWYIQEHLVKELKLPDRGLKANSFHVTRETPSMDSLLLEVGYITHPEEEMLLGSENFRQRAAKAIYEGIVRYFAK